MQAVYAFSKDAGTVQIKKVGKKYCVFPAESVVQGSERNLKWKFRGKADGCWDYRPYDEKDVSDNPDVYFEEQRRWKPYTVRWG